MNYYFYKAVNIDGSLIDGIVEAEDQAAAYEDLTARNLRVLVVKKASKIAARLRQHFISRRVKRGDMVECIRNLSVMLTAGIPLLNALEDSIEATENRSLKSALTDAKKEIELGLNFSDALSRQRGIFPDILIRLVKVGESTGRLDKSLTDVADHLQRIEDLSQAIKRSLFYPVFAIVTTTGAMIFWFVYVLPKIMNVIQEMGVELPLITRALMVVSNAISTYWYVIIGIVILCVIAIQIMRTREKTRYYYDYMLLKLPIVKLIVYNKLLALFAEQMRILIVAGLTIDRTLDIVAGVIDNLVFRRALVAVRENVLLGSRISDTLKDHNIFPPMVTRMVNAGEKSGNLDTQFSFLSGYYIKRLDDISAKLGKMIEPILLSIVGLVFILILMAVLLPVYDLVSKVGKM
ncbi:MAG: type II secretion system F family protein [Syntrophorhabdus sp.]|jgi:type II secretory pathway component PulF|nr:type II secretion system F family protein [Syntrophorhabdus sp.]MDI9557750.1 type II secretion system F family protein [Pseudomonadota bacterium]HNY70139.1 type II secretion system F family protein [Syntrophorhabdus sp.]